MKYLATFCLVISSFLVSAQEEDIVKIIDDLTIKWDKQAERLASFNGMKYYCTSEEYRANTVGLLDKIHHYDTLLYQIVSEKYDGSSDKEAQQTLKDILTVETKYTTPNFIAFLSEECAKFKQIGEEYGREDGSKYYKEVEKLEKELTKYVVNVTNRIDLIDEHVHHLNLD